MGLCAQAGCWKHVAVGWNRCSTHTEDMLASIAFRVLDEGERLDLARRIQSERKPLDDKHAESQRRKRRGEID